MAMVRQCLVDPLRYHPVDDLLLFFFLLLIVVGIVINTLRVNRMRARIRAQKQELQQAVARIEQLATVDELTGLANRRSLKQALAAEGARSQRCYAAKRNGRNRIEP
jgi:predicted signal transduction protein with EAL and GGDEF domain